MSQSQAISTNADLTVTLSGTIAGRFLIKERLGKGGMGEVYRAEDLKLKRTVALKRLAPHLRLDPHYREKFSEEAQRVSSLTDAHIASLYDVIEDDAELFLVMEFVEGETLRERLKRPVSTEEAVSILLQCAEGLAAAHSHGVVHCDIKPENIMVAASGQAKILDFGVAKLASREEQNTTIDRGGSGLSGTPAYMAPEVLAQQQPDGRADIFSLGVVAYELLTGNHPFAAGNFVMTIDRIRREEPVPVRMLNAGVPPALEAVVAKMIVKEPAQRYANASDLVQDLEAVRSGFLPQNTHIARPLSRRSLQLWISAAVLAILLIVAVTRGYRTARDVPLIAERGWALISDFDVHGDSSVPATGVREALAIALEQSRYVNIVPRSRMFEALKRMERPDVTAIDENLGREICVRENYQLLLTGAIEQAGPSFQIVVRAVDPATGTVMFAEKEKVNSSADFFDATDELARRVRNQLGESLSGIESSSRPLAKVTTPSLEALQLYSKADDAYIQGKVDSAAPLLTSALQQDPHFAMAHLLLSRVYLVEGNPAQEIKELDLAYDESGSVTDRERRMIEAEYFDAHGDYEKAAQSMLALVSLSPDDPAARENLAMRYAATDNYPAAIQQLREVLKLNPNSISSYGLLMRYLSRTNAPGEALQWYEQADAHGLHSPVLDWNRGIALMGEDRVADASAQFAALEQAGGAYQSRGRIYLARVLMFQGKLEQARKLLLDEVRIDGAENNRSPELLSRYLLASIYVMQAAPALAKQQLAAVLSPGDAATLQPEDLRRVTTYYARLGDLSRAAQAFKTLETASRAAPSAFNRSCSDNAAGEVALAQHRPEEAAGRFRAALAVYPRVMSHEGLGRVQEGQAHWEEAAAEWNNVVTAKGEILDDASPADWPLAKLRLADAYARMGDDGRALAQYEAVAALWRDSDSFPERDRLDRALRQIKAKQSP
jgi:tetratricopeptide (TPR) repeat protein/tRNA A-37 threonylcarbamoyl transferase component Bud32